MTDLADPTFVDRLQEGDTAAFAVLIEGHHAALRRTARTFVSTEASAEEVVQDTWVAVLAGLPAFERRCSIKTWIYRILVNHAKTKGAREARIELPGDDLGVDDDPHARPDADTPSRALLRKELAGELEAAMLDLPERQRAVVMLRDALGWSPEDVCGALHVNETNQRVLLHRARSRLRASLEHHRAA